jgi:CdiA C-terminal tRNase domain
MRAFKGLIGVVALLGVLGPLSLSAQGAGLLYLPGPGLPKDASKRIFFAGFEWDDSRGQCEPPVMVTWTPAFREQLLAHVEKADIVPIDVRFLTSENRAILSRFVEDLPIALRGKIIIMHGG